MQRINISVEDNLLTRLDAYAKKFGYTRSAFIAVAVNDYLFAKEKEPELKAMMEEFNAKLESLVNQK